MNLLSNLRSMLALLSPDSLNALQRYNPASFRLGFFILSVSMNLFFFPFLHSLVILESFLMTLSFLNQVISGKGLASKMHSRMRSSPSCLIDGFFGKRGGTPSGILGTWPEPAKNCQINIGRFKKQSMTASQYLIWYWFVNAPKWNCFSLWVFFYLFIFVWVMVINDLP